MKKISLLVCAAMMLSLFTAPAGAAGSAAAAKDVDYTIISPYADVDWDTARQYKTALHTHTNASDGTPTLRQSLERHLETGFDIVAITDHGTVSRSWAEENYSRFIRGVLGAVGRSEGELDYLGASGSFAGGTGYTIETSDSGDEILVSDTGRRMLRVPYGIENGAVSVNAHVNSWFAEYQDNTVCDYAKTIRGVEKAGALCVINHPGEYTKAKADLTDEESYLSGHWAYRYYINKFYGLIDRYDCCIGIDMNSKGDSRTRYDRTLWDILLERRAPSGKNVLAIASSDAHQLDKIDTGFVYLLMDDYTSASARQSLEKGAFFAGSHCNGNYKELLSISGAIKDFYGETEVYSDIKAVTDEMAAKIEGVASGELPADTSLGVTYDCLDDEGYCEAGTQPMITKVTADSDADEIRLEVSDALIVCWIADGECVAVTKADGGEATFSLDEYSDKLGAYVRAEVFGEGGTVYTQPFILSYEGQPQPKNYPYLNIPTFDFLFAELRVFGNTLRRFASEKLGM